MALILRLLFLVVFVCLILPYLLPMLGLGQPQKIERVEQEYIERFEGEIAKNRDVILASVDSINFKDKAFKDCIISELSVFTSMLPSSNGSISHVNQLETLRCDRRKITSIEGVNALLSLSYLSLTDNDVQSLKPLRRHTALTFLEINGNKNIKDVEVLGTIKTLTSVILPDLEQSFCAQAESVAKEMEKRHQKKANINTEFIECRGKLTKKMQSILLKNKRGQPISVEEKQKMYDYQENENLKKRIF